MGYLVHGRVLKGDNPICDSKAVEAYFLRACMPISGLPCDFLTLIPYPQKRFAYDPPKSVDPPTRVLLGEPVKAEIKSKMCSLTLK